MTTAATNDLADQSVERTSFINSRLGSLLAVAPLGVWTVAHLWNNLAAFESGEKWQAAVTEYPHPVAQAITLCVVLLPLAWHAVWGTARTLKMRPNNIRYAYYGNLKYLLQRLSAIGLGFFLGAHLWLAMLKPRLTEGRPEAFADLARQMATHPPTLVVYVLGVLAIAYHLGNGAHTALISWGVVSSKTAVKRWEPLAWIVFVLILVMGGGAIYALYQAGAQA